MKPIRFFVAALLAAGVLGAIASAWQAPFLAGASVIVGPPAISAGAAAERVVHIFTARQGDGGDSSASLIADQQGALYGTTRYGGDSPFTVPMVAAGSPSS